MAGVCQSLEARAIKDIQHKVMLPQCSIDLTCEKKHNGTSPLDDDFSHHFCT